MLNTSTMMLNVLESLIYISVFLIGLCFSSRQERCLIYLCVTGTYKVVDFRNCLVNQHAYPWYLYVLWLGLAHLILHLSLCSLALEMPPLKRAPLNSDMGTSLLVYLLVSLLLHIFLSLSHWQLLLWITCSGLKLTHFDPVFLSHI